MNLNLIFGWIATLCFGLCYWPQLWKTYKTKTVADISISQWILQLIGYIVGIFYGLWLNQNALIFGYLHGLVCSSIFLCLYWKYKDNK